MVNVLLCGLNALDIIANTNFYYKRYCDSAHRYVCMCVHNTIVKIINHKHLDHNEIRNAINSSFKIMSVDICTYTCVCMQMHNRYSIRDVIQLFWLLFSPT